MTFPTIDSDYHAAFGLLISPDGRTIYFSAVNPEEKRYIYRRRLDDFHAVPIEGTEGLARFQITPDGRNLMAALSGGVLKRISVDGGPLEPIGIVEGGTGSVSVGPDGTILVGSGDTDIPIRRMLSSGATAPVLAIDKFQDGLVSDPKTMFELSDRISTYAGYGDRFLMVLINDLEASPPVRVIVGWQPSQ